MFLLCGGDEEESRVFVLEARVLEAKVLGVSKEGEKRTVDREEKARLVALPRVEDEAFVDLARRVEERADGDTLKEVLVPLPTGDTRGVSTNVVGVGVAASLDLAVL